MLQSKIIYIPAKRYCSVQDLLLPGFMNKTEMQLEHQEISNDELFENRNHCFEIR